MAFDDLAYTRKKIIDQFLLIQEHGSDGSALGNCKCIQEKHLSHLLPSYLAEGVAIAKDQKEKDFYAWAVLYCQDKLGYVLSVLDENNDEKELKMWTKLSDEMRDLRHEVEHLTFNVPKFESDHIRVGVIAEPEDLKIVLKRCKGINTPFCKELIHAHAND